MIFVAWILLAGPEIRFRVGYEELLAINPLLKECGDNLTMINEEVMREIKDFKNYIKFVIICVWYSYEHSWEQECDDKL